MRVERLKDNHTWKSKPGYSICVVDRGLMRFDYPSNWIVEPEEWCSASSRPAAIGRKLRSRGVDFPGASRARSGLCLDDTLRDTLGNDRKPYQQSEIRHIARGDLEIVWLEQRYIDAEHKRDARFRVALARGPVLCLISMNYWSSRAAGLEGVWDEVLRTLVIGARIEDPAAGPVVQ